MDNGIAFFFFCVAANLLLQSIRCSKLYSTATIFFVEGTRFVIVIIAVVRGVVYYFQHVLV